MSLMTMRLNERRKNAFLSNCFNFTWLGKYRVDIQFLKNRYSVFTKNFNLCYCNTAYFSLPYVVCDLGALHCKSFYNAKEAIEYFNLACYSLISDFAINSQDDFDEFFDLNRCQGFSEWLPELHRFFK